MHIGCPACGTTFSVPDKALRPSGRTLKCAKCGHKWFQDPPPAGAESLAPARAAPPKPKPAPAPRPAPPPIIADFEPEPEPRPSFDFNPVRNPDPEMTFEAPMRSSSTRPSPKDFDLDFDMTEPNVPSLGRGQKSSDRPMDLDLDGDPPPVPSMFATSKEPSPKKGTGGLWFLLVLLLLGGAAGAGYYFQEKLIDLWPPAHELLSEAGLRREKPGAGLELRNAGTPERFVHNDTEVLIVRGIIANISDRMRNVPTMKLVLLDKDKKTVQEKVQAPPAAQLDPGGTSSFRILLERPDPTAVEVNVLFVDPAEETK